MFNQIRYRVTISLAIILLIWPAVHIGLSSFAGLNSWKLSGWGMYASTHPKDVSINVFLIEADEPLANLEIGPVVRTRRVVLFRNGVTQDLDSKALIKNSKIIKYLQVFPTSGVIKSLVQQIKRRLPASIKPDYVLVLRTEPRITLIDGYAYTNTVVYAVQNNEVRNLGEYSTATHQVAELLELVEAEIDVR